jgi:hypothetical protein
MAFRKGLYADGVSIKIPDYSPVQNNCNKQATQMAKNDTHYAARIDRAGMLADSIQ